MPFLQPLLLMATALYQIVACWFEDQSPPPGLRINLGGYALHLWTRDLRNTRAAGTPTIIFEHSLGGSEGYLLINQLAKLAPVCIYDRAGYGWSDFSPLPRTSANIVTELDLLLTQASVKPPYILVGDSFGSYNMRLYASWFPKKVVGMVLTDGLHEAGMLTMPLALRALQLFFVSGFGMSVLGSLLGIVRLLNLIGIFELLKPELRQFPKPALAAVKRSFCRPKHWITMSQEILMLDVSGRQVRSANQGAFPFGALPIVSIKAASFFKPSLWTALIPLRAANQLRDQMHRELSQLSTHCTQLDAAKSGHFVWVDQPEVIVEAVKQVLEKTARITN